MSLRESRLVDVADGGLDLARRDRRLLRARGLDDALEDVVDKRVEDGHGLVLEADCK